NRTDEALEQLFASGEAYWKNVLQVVREQVPAFCPTSVLDYGCGVGRLVIPLARQGLTVTGVDIAESMLRTAREHCDRLKLTNVRFVKADSTLSGLTESSSLVHSFIVFQHIEPARGEKILELLLDRLEPRGVGVLHFTFARDPAQLRNRSWWYRLARGCWRSVRKVLS